MSKTKLNSMRILEQHGIPYEAIAYPNTIRDAEEVAEAIGAPPFMVYKTLVVQSSATQKPALVMLACDRQLDLKRFAQAIGEKKIHMATHADAEKLTGLKVGGISALALLQKNWPIYLDRVAGELQYIYMSAGQRGLQLRVPVAALIQLTRAKLVDASVEKA